MKAAHRRLLIAGLCTLAVLILFRRALTAVAVQLAAAWLMVALALPLCRVLEKRLPPSWAAGLSLSSLALVLIGLVMGVVPPLIEQGRQLSAMAPELLRWGTSLLNDLRNWLGEHGVSLAPVRDNLMDKLVIGAGGVMNTVVQRVRQAASSMSTVLLSPLLAFYLLRDRHKVSSILTLAAPVQYRARVVRAAREMRRETAGYLRGQLLICLFIAILTSLCLLFLRTPGWLVLGLLMGVLELVPYIGPIAAGIPAVLLSLQHGWMQALWTLLALFTIQQLEGTLLSPRLMSGATRLHPAVVLLAISAGGVMFGPWGMMLALPAVVSVRGAVRGARN